MSEAKQSRLTMKPEQSRQTLAAQAEPNVKSAY